MNKKRVERIWRCEGLKVPAKQPKRSRLWLNDGSCVRLRPQSPNDVWSYDFVADRTHDGRAYRMLCIIDEFTRESLAIRVARSSKPPMSSRRSAISSSRGAFQRTSAQTTGPRTTSSSRLLIIQTVETSSRSMTSRTSNFLDFAREFDKFNILICVPSCNPLQNAAGFPF